MTISINENTVQTEALRVMEFTVQQANQVYTSLALNCSNQDHDDQWYTLHSHLSAVS